MKGEKLRALRDAKGFTQAELGNLVGVKANTLSEVENGKKGLHPSKWPAVATALGVPIEELMSDRPADVASLRLLSAFAALSSDDQTAILNHAEALVRTAKLRELAK